MDNQLMMRAMARSNPKNEFVFDPDSDFRVKYFSTALRLKNRWFNYGEATVPPNACFACNFSEEFGQSYVVFLSEESRLVDRNSGKEEKLASLNRLWKITEERSRS